MPRKQPNIFYIYKTTNLVNNKYYVGKHCAFNLDNNYLGSGTRLRRSIRKHGVENFKKEILEFCNSAEELIIREREIVNSKLLQDKLCMNLQLGGGGGFINKEHQRKTASKGRESQKKLRETNPEWVKKRGDKISVARKQEYESGKREINMPDWKGKKHKQKTKQQMSNSHKGKHSKELNSQYGTKWITNGQENKKIKNIELDIYIQQDWVKGRKINC